MGENKEGDRLFMNESLNILVIITILWVLLVFFIWEYKQKKERELEEQLEIRLSQAGIQDIDRMDGFEFEQYLEILFRKLGVSVEGTPESGDFGADLILDGRERVVVQAKRYQKKVGVRAVQEVNAARAYYSAQGAWVITNNFFTEATVELAEATNVKLIDRCDLVDIILNSNTTSFSIEIS